MTWTLNYAKSLFQQDSKTWTFSYANNSKITNHTCGMPRPVSRPNNNYVRKHL